MNKKYQEEVQNRLARFICDELNISAEEYKKSCKIPDEIQEYIDGIPTPEKVLKDKIDKYLVRDYD